MIQFSAKNIDSSVNLILKDSIIENEVKEINVSLNQLPKVEEPTPYSSQASFIIKSSTTPNQRVLTKLNEMKTKLDQRDQKKQEVLQNNYFGQVNNSQGANQSTKEDSGQIKDVSKA